MPLYICGFVVLGAALQKHLSVGALIMGVLNMGLSITGVNPSWQFIIKGLVLLVAVAFDLVNKRRSGSSA